MSTDRYLTVALKSPAYKLNFSFYVICYIHTSYIRKLDYNYTIKTLISFCTEQNYSSKRHSMCTKLYYYRIIIMN